MVANNQRGWHQGKQLVAVLWLVSVAVVIDTQSYGAMP